MENKEILEKFRRYFMAFGCEETYWDIIEQE